MRVSSVFFAAADTVELLTFHLKEASQYYPSRGWFWADLDKTGACGLVDGVFVASFTGDVYTTDASFASNWVGGGGASHRLVVPVVLRRSSSGFDSDATPSAPAAQRAVLLHRAGSNRPSQAIRLSRRWQRIDRAALRF